MAVKPGQPLQRLPRARHELVILSHFPASLLEGGQLLYAMFSPVKHEMNL